MPLKFHPAAIRVSANVTPFGARRLLSFVLGQMEAEEVEPAAGNIR
jgi:hypothetical protein